MFWPLYILINKFVSQHVLNFWNIDTLFWPNQAEIEQEKGIFFEVVFCYIIISSQYLTWSRSHIEDYQFKLLEEAISGALG